MEAAFKKTIPEEADDIAFIKPKKKAADKIRHGFHCPKIKTASAKKP